MEWHNQDIERLIKNTFNPYSVNNEIPRTLPLSQENEFLFNLNSSIKNVTQINDGQLFNLYFLLSTNSIYKSLLGSCIKHTKALLSSDNEGSLIN